MEPLKNWREYDSIRKIILKNTNIEYYRMDKENKDIIPAYPTEQIPDIIRNININPEVLEALEQYFRGKFDEEKETEINVAANNLES